MVSGFVKPARGQDHFALYFINADIGESLGVVPQSFRDEQLIAVSIADARASKPPSQLGNKTLAAEGSSVELRLAMLERPKRLACLVLHSGEQAVIAFARYSVPSSL
mmetsp:Transcript_304/g.900  ORF Transcript_304/g.900 Transcript_304/m.900 type:complete len:107 (-) Transcript_304:299-619(-)|eukprot:scaffold250252_cov33-Tisochrysis_lutea.AAC.2